MSGSFTLLIRLWTVLTPVHLLGLMATAHLVMPLGLLAMRHLQRWFASINLGAKGHNTWVPPLSRKMPASGGSLQSLWWWGPWLQR